MKLSADRQMTELGVFVHGALVGLHLLGVVYNLRRHNWVDMGAHTAAALYDTWAVHKHLRDLAPFNDTRGSTCQ